MKKQQITLTIILILLCLDVVLLIMDRKARAEMNGKDPVAAEQKPSIQDVAKSVRAMLNDDLEEEENSSPQAERRQQRRKVREERAYTLMALDALRMRIVKEAKQKALQGRNVCGPYLDMVNGYNNMLRNMVGEESKKMAPRVVKLNTPLFRAGMAEHKELMLKKREQINEFMHHLDTSRFDDATAMAHADYVYEKTITHTLPGRSNPVGQGPHGNRLCESREGTFPLWLVYCQWLGDQAQRSPMAWRTAD